MEKMVCGFMLSLMVALLLNVASSEAAATKHQTLERTNDDINIAMSSQGMNEDMVIRRSREIGSILLTIKNHIKGIILDIIREACNSIRSFMSNLMNKLLSKLQLFTFSDVLLAIMNSFTESTSDLRSELFVDTAAEPVEVDSWEAEVYRNPYYSASLLNMD